MFKILFVCTGNTCRSPMAAALLSEMAAKAGLAGTIVIDSAGIAAAEQAASIHAQSVMRQSGLALDKHCSKQLTLTLLSTADLVLTMTVSHKRAVASIAAGITGEIYTLAEFAGQTGDIVDPFGGSEAEYRKCAEQLRQLLALAWEKIVCLAGEK